MNLTRRLRALDDRAGVDIDRPVPLAAVLVAFVVLAVGAFALSLANPLAGAAAMGAVGLLLAVALRGLGRLSRRVPPR